MQRRVSLGLLCSALAAACSSDPRTQVIVRIEADPGVEARIERLHVVVENLQDPESPVELDRTVGIGEGDGETTLPAHVPLVPRFGDAERRFRVVAEALEGALPEGGSAFARVEAESSYVRGETRVLVLRFEDDCIEVECNQGTTCRNGACRPSRVDPETLPPWPLDAGTTPSPTDGGMDADANDASDARDAADATDGADARDAPDVPSDCDRDGDGHAAMGERCRGDDCDDSAPAVHPGATETCNGEDDDCDGAIDDGVGMTFYRDVDRDGYGASGVAMLGCTAPEGFVAQDGDCDDANRNVNPGVTETCNGTDDDCDGATDPGCACTIGMEVACGTGMVGGASRCVRGVQRCA
ncbi:MAG: putative metal-binding motif-containing protein, partial [Deltaproteobacteria bacterium]|nr:putative metal-binding motif-containing protein [Deltaproteobacteria bacterium]